MKVIYLDLEVTGYHLGHVALFAQRASLDDRITSVKFVLPGALRQEKYAAIRDLIERQPKLSWEPCSPAAEAMWSSWIAAGGRRRRTRHLGLSRLDEIDRLLKDHPDHLIFDSLFDTPLSTSAWRRRSMQRRVTGIVHFASAAVFGGRLSRLRHMAPYALVNHHTVPIVLTFDSLFLERAPGTVTRGWRFIPDPLPVNAPQWERLFSLPAAPAGPRTRFLMFGSMGRRKGVFSLLEALESQTDEELASLEIRVRGQYAEGGDAEREAFVTGVKKLQGRDPLCISYEDRFLGEDELIDELGSAHIVLAPYLAHSGVSNVLVWAAAAGRPILTQSAGWLGHMTEARHLGITCDTREPQRLAEALTACQQTGVRATFDATDMRVFAQRHTPDGFYGVIVDALADLSQA